MHEVGGDHYQPDEENARVLLVCSFEVVQIAMGSAKRVRAVVASTRVAEPLD